MLPKAGEMGDLINTTMNKLFTTYLQERGLADSTIECIHRSAKAHRNWLKLQNTRPKDMRYNKVIQYVQHMKDKGLSVRSINLYLNHLRHYYNHLSGQKVVIN